MNQINRALRLLREFHRMKQGELAAKLEISPSYLSEIETGAKRPSIDLIEQYGKVFKMPPSSILFIAEAEAAGGTSAKISNKALKMLEWMALVDA